MLAGLPATAGTRLIPRSVIQAAPASDDDFTFFPQRRLARRRTPLRPQGGSVSNTNNNGRPE